MSEPAQPVLPDTQPKAKPMDSRTLLDLLRKHFIGPEDLPGGVFLTEVQMPHEGHNRFADALYLSFTASRGHAIDVCELKVSRADFKAELNNPVKAEAWWPHSTRWWIVSPAPEVTPPDLLPEGWGLMCPSNRGRRFKVWREPAVRQPVVTLKLLIEIAKKLDTMRAQQVRRAQDEARWEWQQKLDEVRRERVDRASALTDEQRTRLDAIAEVERVAGVKLRPGGTSWWSEWSRDLTPDDFGAAMRMAGEGVAAKAEARQRVRGMHGNLRMLRGLLDQFDDALTRADKALE